MKKTGERACGTTEIEKRKPGGRNKKKKKKKKKSVNRSLSLLCIEGKEDKTRSEGVDVWGVTWHMDWPTKDPTTGTTQKKTGGGTKGGMVIEIVRGKKLEDPRLKKKGGTHCTAAKTEPL